MRRVTIELSHHEAAALLLLLKLGVDVYEGNEVSDEVLETMRGIPNQVRDGMISKVGRVVARAAN